MLSEKKNTGKQQCLPKVVVQRKKINRQEPDILFCYYRTKGVSSESVPDLGVGDRPSQAGAARAQGMR